MYDTREVDINFKLNVNILLNDSYIAQVYRELFNYIYIILLLLKDIYRADLWSCRHFGSNSAPETRGHV